METTSKDMIASTLQQFRTNYKLIQQIDSINYMKQHFSCKYFDKPSNLVEECYKEYVDAHNEICQQYLIDLSKQKIKTVSEGKRIYSLMDSIQMSLIIKSRLDWAGNGIIPDINILRGFSEISDIAQKLSTLNSHYRFELFPKICNAMIEELENKAFEFLTNITQETLLEMNHEQVLKKCPEFVFSSSDCFVALYQTNEK